MLEYVMEQTREYINHMPKTLRKKYGQFFTSKETAVFMASLFTIPIKEEISILDPGAGSGILSIALVERINKISLVKKIELTCYENDEYILDLLISNLSYLCENSTTEINYNIISDNYILSQNEEYNNINNSKKHTRKFDLIIGNPPYLKIAKNTPEAIVMSNICYGAPNLYFLFAEMSLFNLKDNGEMVYIIPRSWTSGTYFEKFRRLFLNSGKLEHIHLFINRNKVFEQEKVLQETVIIKVKKSSETPSSIKITTTKSNSDFSEITEFIAPYNLVVNSNNFYVYLVTNANDLNTLQKLNQWNETLLSIGLKMRTGLTVDFRNTKELRNEPDEKTVPLFYSQHIQNGKIKFPINKKNEYIIQDKEGLLQKNTNYLFVKRFTAKEEKRRLQCGIYLSKDFSEFKKISTQNKINFICGTRELSECVVYGLFVLFNSTLYDNYYRILDGSTQVNSTEINNMPIPPLSIIKKMGLSLIEAKDLSESKCDDILRSYL